ncbi:putative remorin [Lupinus albus]|uniref:Putative remorin n=1 Tax=Lupinus albus TaxID=3870 RepID=A0A6A4QQT7_LUPAL|nr:putative remorin [Lupinus albus]
MNMHGNNKNNPFENDFTDPLCKLNLNESSEFVKSFAMPNGNAETKNNTATQRHRRLHASSTTVRPVFSFISNVGLGRNLARKRFPSKWDDAEKWLMNTTSTTTTTTTTSFHDSPPYVKLSLSESSKNRKKSSRKFDTFKQQMENRVTVNEERVTKPVPTFQRSASFEHYNPFGAFNGVVAAYSTDHIALKDKFTDSIEPIMPNFRYSEPTQEGFLFRNLAEEAVQDAYTEVIHDVHHRDVGKEMTPLRSSTTSRCHTPIKSSSPTRHNTPETRSGLLALPNPNGTKVKLGTINDIVSSNWSTSEEEEEEEEEKEISKSLRHNSNQKSDSACRVAKWEEDEKNKCYLRYEREEAKIQAWVNLQNAKAEAQSRKLEVFHFNFFYHDLCFFVCLSSLILVENINSVYQ